MLKLSLTTVLILNPLSLCAMRLPASVAAKLTKTLLATQRHTPAYIATPIIQHRALSSLKKIVAPQEQPTRPTSPLKLEKSASGRTEVTAENHQGTQPEAKAVTQSSDNKSVYKNISNDDGCSC